MAKPNPNEPHRLGGPTLVEEGDLYKGVKWQFPKGIKRFWERWKTEKYGGVQAAMGKQIGGQIPMRGPDILKYIKKYDPDNSSGAVKNALDIMLKLQEGSTKPNDLYTSIQPLQNILGGNMYGMFKSSGAGAKSSDKAQQAQEQLQQQPQEQQQQEPQEQQQQPSEDIILELIMAAMAKLTPEDAELTAELLDVREIDLIRKAYYRNGKYVSANPDMPIAFVNAINILIPIFKATKGSI